ncbi:MAG: ComF family protein [Lachnospiraceae bacterium]|nr:ComF family protein [Lachnospiraceae bacterium]
MRNMLKFFDKAAKIIMQWLFPLRCPICDGIVVPYGEKICLRCMGRLKLISPPWCMRCGKKLRKQGEYCEDCRRRQHNYIRGRALYEYDSVAEAIYRFKYGGRAEYADFFGEEIFRYLGDFIREVSPDALVPIPLHKSRRKKRGYNQAELIAEAVSGYSGIPVYKKLLRRVKNTKPLKLQNPVERQNNLKKAFIIAQNDVKLDTILIIDDIYTTGSTIDEAAAVLRKAGVKNIYFITLACGQGM